MNLRQIILVGSTVTVLASATLAHAQATSQNSVAAMATRQPITSQVAEPRIVAQPATTSSSASVDTKAWRSRSATPTATPTAAPTASLHAPATTHWVKPATPTLSHAIQAPKAQPPASATAPKASVARNQQTSGQTSDLYWLARAVEAEAGGEPMAVKLAVADVVLNRIHSTLYPNRVQQVIFQQVNGHYAFTSVTNGWIYHQPSAASVNAAREALLAGKNIVPSALVFYNSSQTPAQSWVRTRPVIATLGSLTFAQ